jgi:hypothetical protein
MSAGFVQLSDAELQQMDLSSLQAYAAQVAAIIDSESSTVTATQAIQSQYDYLILNSQSTLTGLSYDITTNSNLIIAADVKSNALVLSNTILDSTIASYTSTIIGQTSVINNADTTMSSLMAESADITSKLAQSDLNFISAAKYYSSLYTIFIGKDMLYQTYIDNIMNTSTLLSNAIVTQNASYANWQTSSAYTVARSAELAQLYKDSNAIQSSLTQYRIDEIRANTNLISTNYGIQAISSLYGTSLINQQYYQTLSTQGSVLELYTSAYSTFQTAARLSNASPNNTLITAAATMAQQRLSTLTVAKALVATQATELQGLVAGAVTDTYAAQLALADAAVQLEIENINTFQGYANSSLAAVTYFSTLYDTASAQVASSMAAVKIFSSFYESSVTGSNTYMAMVMSDTVAVAAQQAQVDAISMSLSSLNDQYNNYTSSYTGWMTISTSMNSQITAAKSDLIIYSSLYESTNIAINTYTQLLANVDTQITNNNTIIRTQSTILEAETINALTYQNQIATSFAMEESAVFLFRETYVRQKLLAAQQYYDACVLSQVQITSTQNGNLKTQAAGSSIVPIPINLNTATINNANTILNNITAFLTTFTTIYSNYTTQVANLQNVSTSLSAQSASFSNVTTIANAFMTDPTQGGSFSNVQTDFIKRQVETKGLQANVALTQSQIDAAKGVFLTTYRQTFTSNEIMANETMISSFLIQGFAAAI